MDGSPLPPLKVFQERGVRFLAIGREFEIALERQCATVVEIGGGLRSYAVDGRDVVDGYGAGDLATAGRGQLLVPWPNRIEEGRYEFAGRGHQLRLTEPARSNAIHGLVRTARWQLLEHEACRVVLGHVLESQPGYPFSLELTVEYEVSADGLAVRLTATNVGADACPYGAGAHPYLWPRSANVDDALLDVPARILYTTDARGIPTGSMPVEGTEFDFRRPRHIGATRIDHCFTDLVREGDGRARIVLDDVQLWADEAFKYVLVYTGDTEPDVERRSLGVEPMTCPPNAFRSGEGLVILERGASHTATWGLAPS